MFKCLKELREKHRIKRPDFARQLGVTSNYIGLIERGQRLPSVKLLLRIGNILGYKVCLKFVPQ